MRKKKEHGIISIYGNVILVSDSDIISGNVTNNINELVSEIDITNNTDGNYIINFNSETLPIGSDVEIYLEVYDANNTMYKSGDVIKISSHSDLVNSYMVNFVINEDNIVTNS